MAQNLQQRLIAAKSPRARTSDNETLLVDLRAEVERLANARDTAAGESIDFALSDQDRDEAAAKAARLDRTIKALEVEIAEVAVLTEQRKNEDARKAAEAAKRSALSERDEIAARFAKRVPALMSELIELLAAVQSNADRMRLAGVNEANAELIARGMPANGHLQMTPVPRFTEMKIPSFHDLERAWPIDHERQMLIRTAETTRRDRIAAFLNVDRDAKAKAKAAADYRRTHGRYELTVEASIADPDSVVRFPEELVTGDIPGAMGPWDRKQLMISHEVAKKLGAVPRLKVKLLDGGPQ